MLFTPTGLEQATRWPVAVWRAGILAAAGVRRILDLGCGLGVDALAMAEAGLTVTAVERDPATALLAAANLRGRAEVICADATESLARAEPGDAVFLDPARRSDRGRSWRTEDLSPSWDFTLAALRDHPGCVKLGPGFPTSELPPELGFTWVSESGDLVEATGWSGIGWPAETRTAVLLPGAAEWDAGDRRPPPVRPLGRYLYEPGPAVLRSGGSGSLARTLQAGSVHAGIGYLSGDTLLATRFATAFAVVEVLPFDERTLRGWVREHGVGTLEIKVRGLEVDPAVLRRRLKPKGDAAVTLVITPTTQGVRALVVERVRGEVS